MESRNILELVTLTSLLVCCSIFFTNGEQSVCLPPNSTSLILDPPQDNYTINQIVALSCTPSNFTLIGPFQITCSVGGQWDARLPICVEVKCSRPEAPEYGLAELEYFNDTDIRVAFSCLYKYTLVGVSQVSCDPDSGTWSDPEPDCFASCGEPPGVSFGRWQVACMHENCSAIYHCDSGYAVIGSGKVTCQADGLWSELTTYCQMVTCQAPAITDFSNLATDRGPNYENRYHVGTNATYRCFSNKYMLLGNKTITCLEDGSWSSLPPICELAPTTTSTTTQSPPSSESTTTSTLTTLPTTTPEGAIPCPEPPSLQFGSFRRYSRFIIYRCHYGYVLLGNDERHCYDNGNWSGTLPKCVAVSKAPATNKPYHWKQVFIDHGKWQGHYDYQGQTVTFTFTVQSVQLDPPPAVMGLFKEGTIKFQLKGSEQKSGEVVFRMMKLFVATERFPSIDWSTRGWLQQHPCRWTYTGTIETPLKGFQSFHMETKRLDRVNSEECKSSGSKSTEYIVVGVFLSVLVVCVPLVALLWIRRDRLIQGRGHRTLTSFENPVYEYENGLK